MTPQEERAFELKSQSKELRRRLAREAEIKVWSDIAYEMWALLCNSIPFEPRSAGEWNGQRDRLRDRFHAALAELYDGQPAADHHARLAADPFEHADGAPCSDPWCEDKTKPGPVCDGPLTCPGVNVCDRTDCDRARLAAGTEEG